MDGLYPVIRRVRRPLINTGRLVVPVVVPAPRIEQEGTEGTEVLPHGQSGPREAGPTLNIQQPTPNIEGEVTARQEVLPHGQRPTPDERKERHARKTKEA